MKTRVSMFWASALSMLLPLSAAAQQAPPEYWPGPWHMWGGAWGGWWWLCALAFAVVVGVVMFAVGRCSGRHPGGESRGK